MFSMLNFPRRLESHFHPSSAEMSSRFNIFGGQCLQLFVPDLELYFFTYMRANTEMKFMSMHHTDADQLQAINIWKNF